MPMNSLSRAAIAGGQTWFNDRAGFFVPSPRHVNGVALVADTHQRQAVPAGAVAVVFSADGDFFALAGGESVEAEVLDGSLADGSASALSPAGWILEEGVTHISLVAAEARKITLWFYVA